MGGGLLLVSALVCLALVGVLAATVLGIDSPLRLVLAAYVVGWATLASTATVLSLPGWLTRWTLTLSLAGVAATMAGIWLARGRPPARFSVPWSETLRDPIICTLAVVVAAAGVYVGATAFLTTPNEWDGLTYHETRALLWDQQHGIGYVPAGNDPRLNGNPPISEIGLYLTMLLPRSERYAALPQFFALWASVIAVALAGRRLGLPRPAAAYGGLVFATLPLVVLQGAAILNDLVVASFLLATVVFLLDRGRAVLALGAVSLALALGTKLVAVLALPLMFLVVLAAVARGRRPAAALALAVGVALGSPWYLLNDAKTGSFDGDLSSSTGQAADHSFGAIVGTLRALAFDVLDTSGFWRSELFVAAIVGAALIVAGILARGRFRADTRTLVAAGAVTLLVPLGLRSVADPARWLWEHAWLKLGRDDVALAHPNAWEVLGLPDTSLSWYGAAGTIVVLGGVAAALVGIRRAELTRAALLFALAPAILVVTFAFTIVYDPWRGRLVVFAVGLACAAWGWTLRIRWLSIGMAALCTTSLSLSLVHSYTKPTGFGVLESPIDRSIWHRDRIDALTVIRDYDGTPGLLREVEARVPPTAELDVATPVDSFLAPLAGERLSRTLRLVADGEHVPAGATWLVAREPAGVRGCVDAWTTVYRDTENDWRLLRRISPDDCGARTDRL